MWFSGCLDGLDKDIKGKQKAALWIGHRRGQTNPFSTQVGVSVQSCLTCREMGEVLVSCVCMGSRLIILSHNICKCIFDLFPIGLLSESSVFHSVIDHE